MASKEAEFTQKAHAFEPVTATIAAVGLISAAIGLWKDGSDIYKSHQGDELSDSARSLIEQSLQEQLVAGLGPIRRLSDQERKALGAQGRVELSLAQIKVRLDQWGKHLSSGQTDILTTLKKIGAENQKEHEKTQRMIRSIHKAEFLSGLRLFNNGMRRLAIATKQEDDFLKKQALQGLQTAVAKLETTRAFFEEALRSGFSASTEQRALVYLSLASYSLCIGDEEGALDPLVHLLALPSRANGLNILLENLPERIRAAKLSYAEEYANATAQKPLLRQFRLFEDIAKGLKIAVKAVQLESSRLDQLKQIAHDFLKGNPSLAQRWEAKRQHTLQEREELEAEAAMVTFNRLSAEFNASPCAIRGCPDVKWITIPAGSFQMGSNDGAADEKPVHSVRVKAFLMSETEVTVGQYRKCVEAGRCEAPSMQVGQSTWTSSPRAKRITRSIV